MTQPAYDADVLDFTARKEPTQLDILERDFGRAMDRQSHAEGKVNIAKLHMEQAQAEYDAGKEELEAAAAEVQKLKRIIHAHELNALKPRV